MKVLYLLKYIMEELLKRLPDLVITFLGNGLLPVRVRTQTGLPVIIEAGKPLPQD